MMFSVFVLRVCAFLHILCALVTSDLVTRAHKISSNAQTLKTETENILKYMSWNGFPKTLSKKLIKQFSPKPDSNRTAQDSTITHEEANRLP